MAKNAAAGLSPVAKIGWAIGELGLASHVGVTMIYLMFFLTEVHAIPAAMAGIALLIPRIWSVLTDPIVGSLSDRTRSRFGRRRPYLMLGSLVWGITFFLMFYMPETGSQLSFIIGFSILYFLVCTGLTLYQVPYSAMSAEMTQDYRERASLAGYKEIAARAGVLLAVMCSPLLIDAGESQRQGFIMVGLVFGGMIALSGIVAFFATAKAPVSSFEPQSLPLKAQFKALRNNKPLTFLVASFTCVNMADAVFSGAMIYYITVVTHQPTSLMGLLYPVGSVTGMVLAPVWSWLAGRFGKKEIYKMALAGMSLTCLFPLVLPPSYYVLLYPFMFFYGLFNTGCRLVPNAMVPDTVELDELHTGRRREGAIYGIWIFIQQTGLTVGGFILSLLLAVIGYHGGDHKISATTVHGLTLSYTLGPAFLYAAGYFLILKYTLSESDFDVIKSNIRNASKP